MHLDATLPDRMVERLTDNGLAIFLFHGVIKRQRHRVRNYTGKHIEADLFVRCMKRIAHTGHAISMDDVLSHCETGEPFPARAFAVTFDDGFENNVSVAAPILADLRIPAIIYVTSGFIEENGMSWIDRIEYAVEEAPAQALTVDWADQTFRLTNTENRIAFLKAVRQYVKNNRECNANVFADELCARLGKPGELSSDDPLDLKLNWQQVREIQDSELMSIGGHSHTHPILTFLDEKQLAFELDTSLSLLRDRATVGPTHYSYPEGLSHCYSDRVIMELRKRGVRCSPTAIDGTNKIGADPFHLRRIMIG